MTIAGPNLEELADDEKANEDHLSEPAGKYNVGSQYQSLNSNTLLQKRKSTQHLSDELIQIERGKLSICNEKNKTEIDDEYMSCFKACGQMLKHCRIFRNGIPYKRNETNPRIH